MSPVRSPSPFEGCSPGDALLSSSITLEGGVPVSVPGPSVTSRLPKGEVILLKPEDLYPSVANGKPRSRAAADFLKRLADAVAVVGRGGVARASTVPEDDSSSADPGEAGVGTCSIILSTKKAIFDEALSSLDSLSRSVYMKAHVDPEAEGSLSSSSSSSADEVIQRVEMAGLSCDGEAGESNHDCRVTASGFVLINVHNDLSGEGQGYLLMHELDGNDPRGDMDVCYSGAGF